MDTFHDFDAWCLLQGFDPLEIPSYRLYNLALYKMMEGLDAEGRNLIEQQLKLADRYESPFQRDILKVQKAKTRAKQAGKTAPAGSEPVETGSKITGNLEPRSSQDYVPPWWRGDETNYQIARTMMVTLPKAEGQKSI